MPCAVVATGEKGTCFTCRFGKTSCSLAAKKRKKAELEKGEEEEKEEVQVKIVRKEVKKPKVEKQDVKMTEVSEGAEDGGQRRFESKSKNQRPRRTSKWCQREPRMLWQKMMWRSPRLVKNRNR